MVMNRPKSRGLAAIVQLPLRRALSTRPPPSLSRYPSSRGSLYDAAAEKDSCGVGMVASLKGTPSHKIVKDANTMLVRMAHRGGCGCDPYSGDGAGILTGMPDGFLRKAVKAELGKELPPLGQYAAGVIFFPKEAGAIAACKAAFEKQIAAQGLGLVGWRPLPVDNSELGATSLESEPHSEMLLVSPKEGTAPADFPRELYKLRIAASAALKHDPANDDFYVNSLNTSTIVYKGQLTPEQVWGYFKDLQVCVFFITPARTAQRSTPSLIFILLVPLSHVPFFNFSLSRRTPPTNRTSPSSTPASRPTPSPRGRARNPSASCATTARSTRSAATRT